MLDMRVTSSFICLVSVLGHGVGIADGEPCSHCSSGLPSAVFLNGVI